MSYFLFERKEQLKIIVVQEYIIFIASLANDNQVGIVDTTILSHFTCV
jgi:hypothetical protein